MAILQIKMEAKAAYWAYQYCHVFPNVSQLAKHGIFKK